MTTTETGETYMHKIHFVYICLLVIIARRERERERKRGVLYIFILFVSFYMSRIVRKPDFCLGENKGADQLRGNREADQRLCFRYSDSTIPLLLKSEISSF